MSSRRDGQGEVLRNQGDMTEVLLRPGKDAELCRWFCHFLEFSKMNLYFYWLRKPFSLKIEVLANECRRHLISQGLWQEGMSRPWPHGCVIC